METIEDIVREMRERDDECGNGWLDHYADRIEAVNNRALELSEKLENAEAALQPVLECDPDITMPYSSVLAVAKTKMIFSKAVAGNE